MKQYYYTVASLPAVSFDGEPPLTAAQFAEICDVELTDEDRAYIDSASIRLDGPEAQISGGEDLEIGGVLREWTRLLREFQQQMALVRAGALGWEVERLPRPDMEDAGIPERVRQILNEENPLKQELSVLRWLWSAADALEPGHHFDREIIALYHLKLQIALRRARILDAEAGNEEFERQYTNVAESLMEIAT